MRKICLGIYQLTKKKKNQSKIPVCEYRKAQEQCCWGRFFSGPDRKARGESLTAWVLNYLFEVEASFIQTHV